MALDINGYNNAFRGFVQFAEHRAGLGFKGMAVKATKVNAQYILGSASDTSTSWLNRTKTDEKDNDNARRLFRNAVIDMFGGSLKKVPKSVQTAALFENNKKAKIILGNGIFAARVFKHIDELEALLAKKGKLSAKDVFTTCFPDIDAKALLQRRGRGEGRGEGPAALRGRPHAAGADCRREPQPGRRRPHQRLARELRHPQRRARRAQLRPLEGR